MALELLKIPDINNRIEKCYMLFPTIERMAVSSNGFWFTKLVQPLWFLFRYVYIIFGRLPVQLQVFLLAIYFFVMRIPRTFLGTALKYSRMSITEKVLLLADEEMKQVRVADVATIQANRERIRFYYGASDGWTPLKYCEELRQRVPGLDAIVDAEGISHAFVLRSSHRMGQIVGEWISQRKAN